MTVHIPPHFPQDYPRIIINNKIQHPNVTVDGYPYYTVKSSCDQVAEHIEQVIKLLEEQPLTHPLTHLNKHAASLCFGSDHDKRRYKQEFLQVK